MNNQQLIEQLQQHPPDAEVTFRFWDSGWGVQQVTLEDCNHFNFQTEQMESKPTVVMRGE